MTQAFTTQLENGIAEIVIDKAPVNALDSSEWHALAALVNQIGQNPDARVLIIRSQGRGFCAGVDIKELDQHPERIVTVNAGNYETFKAVHLCPIPVIVALHVMC